MQEEAKFESQDNQNEALKSELVIEDHEEQQPNNSLDLCESLPSSIQDSNTSTCTSFGHSDDVTKDDDLEDQEPSLDDTDDGLMNVNVKERRQYLLEMLNNAPVIKPRFTNGTLDPKDMPCLHCKFIEMGEMACYTKTCPECGR